METALLGVDCLLVFFLVAFSSRSGTKGGFVECRFSSSCWGRCESKMDGGMESRGDVRIEDLMARLIAARKPLVLVLGSLLVAVLVSLLLVFRGGRRSKSSPPVVATIPIIGGLLKFVKGPINMLAEEYPRLGSVFTVKVLTRNVTFLVGPEVSAHFFKAQEADMSQKEVMPLLCTCAFFPHLFPPSIAQGLLLLLLLLLGFFHTTRQYHRCVVVFVERKKERSTGTAKNFFS